MQPISVAEANVCQKKTPFLQNWAFFPGFLDFRTFLLDFHDWELIGCSVSAAPTKYATAADYNKTKA